ncbi:Aste57867_21305 [Aphanomyces stellatus]|uniref:Aste57867_21305 protein n=1 Tax=Aphanomyces stellatus TaxID=120398 RepID=A0A485LH85_9STRA|nr:hypothetical protein As57867_021236 [Aphanomyces stellatus]VFT97977.1 Aste57867_21305 [Aphanomyces stellatus]
MTDQSINQRRVQPGLADMECTFVAIQALLQEIPCAPADMDTFLTIDTTTTPFKWSSPTSSPRLLSPSAVSDTLFFHRGAACILEEEEALSFMALSSTSRQDETLSAREYRRRAILRRNHKRRIVPHPSSHAFDASPCLPQRDDDDGRVVPGNIDGSLDSKKRTSRIAAALYRDKQRHRHGHVVSEIEALLATHPHLQAEKRVWTPRKKVKSPMDAGEDRETYRKRCNRESAAFSRQQQLDQLDFWTTELARLRLVAASVSHQIGV